MSSEELTCTYACLALHDDGIPITVEKIATMVKAANVIVESYWLSLFAKLVEKRSIEELIVNVGASGGAGGVPAAFAAAGGGFALSLAAAALASVEKKESPRTLIHTYK